MPNRGHIGDAPAIEKIGKYRSDNRASANECRLHSIAGRMLILAQHITDKGAERFHRHI